MTGEGKPPIYTNTNCTRARSMPISKSNIWDNRWEIQTKASEQYCRLRRQWNETAEEWIDHPKAKPTECKHKEKR